MLYFILVLAALGLIVPVLRIFGAIILVLCVVGYLQSSGTSTGTTGPQILSFEQLQHLQMDCKNKGPLLEKLEYIEKYKNYKDIDNVLGDEYRYMELLKSDIWYLRRECQ